MADMSLALLTGLSHLIEDTVRRPPFLNGEIIRLINIAGDSLHRPKFVGERVNCLLGLHSVLIAAKGFGQPVCWILNSLKSFKFKQIYWRTSVSDLHSHAMQLATWSHHPHWKLGCLGQKRSAATNSAALGPDKSSPVKSSLRAIWNDPLSFEKKDTKAEAFAGLFLYKPANSCVRFNFSASKRDLTSSFWEELLLWCVCFGTFSFSW